MDTESTLKLVALLRERSLASLGTLRDDAPFVSMILFSVADDFSEFYIHASKLAFHTQDILRDPRVSLMIVEDERANPDPQQLARISIRGEAALLSPDDASYPAAQAGYLKKFPQSANLFSFGDFSLYRIVPQSARYVAGFAKAFNLTPASFRNLVGK